MKALGPLHEILDEVSSDGRGVWPARRDWFEFHAGVGDHDLLAQLEDIGPREPLHVVAPQAADVSGRGVLQFNPALLLVHFGQCELSIPRQNWSPTNAH